MQRVSEWVSEWVSESEGVMGGRASEQYFSYIIARISHIRWDDNDGHSVLDQQI